MGPNKLIFDFVKHIKKQIEELEDENKELKEEMEENDKETKNDFGTWANYDEKKNSI